MTTEFWIGTSIQMVVFAVMITTGFMAVKMSIKVVETKIETLEEKQDKHNALIERTYNTESSTKSAHHRLDGVDKAIIHIEEGVRNLEVDHAKMIGIIEDRGKKT